VGSGGAAVGSGAVVGVAALWQAPSNMLKTSSTARKAKSGRIFILSLLVLTQINLEE
jgi:hypothetical protein